VSPVSEPQYAFSSIEVRDRILDVLVPRYEQCRAQAQAAPTESREREVWLGMAEMVRHNLIELGKVFGFELDLTGDVR
jgi:hypothetical protein